MKNRLGEDESCREGQNSLQGARGEHFGQDESARWCVEGFRVRNMALQLGVCNATT